MQQGKCSDTLFSERKKQMSTTSRRHHHHGHTSNAEVKVGSAEHLAPASQNVDEYERSHLIQVRAYGLWEQAGKPDGDASRERFWCEAEKELMASHARNE
jgi:hypothetical protein